MNLEINKDGAMFIQNAILYYLKMGAKNWYHITYPSIDLQEIMEQLKLIEEIEE